MHGHLCRLGHHDAVFQRDSVFNGFAGIEVKDFEAITDEPVVPSTMAYTDDGDLKRLKKAVGIGAVYSV